MRTYYLFEVKNMKRTYLNAYILYNELKEINKNYNNSKLLNKFYLRFNPIKKNILINYVENKYQNRYKKINNEYTFYSKKTNELTLVNIKYSHILIKTNINIPRIFKIFNIYNSNILVVDFKLNDFFWLDNISLKENMYIS